MARIKQAQTTLLVRIDMRTKNALRDEASAKGVSLAGLVRMVLRSHLVREKARKRRHAA